MTLTDLIRFYSYIIFLVDFVLELAGLIFYAFLYCTAGFRNYTQLEWYLAYLGSSRFIMCMWNGFFISSLVRKLV